MEEKISEAEVCMVLDTYMYLNYQGAADGQTLKEIIEDLPLKIDVEDEYYKEYSVVSKAVENPQIGNLKIKCQAQNMGYNEGTNAVSFITEDNSKAYVIYRGTADGEWLDNGYGMIDPMTIQQKEAVKYYDRVVEELDLESCGQVYISGHSKGGNKVQYVAMESENADLITACYSIDGQGHSDAAIKRWKDKYGEDEYENRTERIYSINGQNDFVSVLGNCIVPAANISFLETPADMADFAGYHDITRMFASKKTDENGKTVLEYHGCKNRYVLDRGELGDYVADLSENIMGLPAMIREGSAVTLMQAAEIFNMGKLIGVNNEHITSSDFISFFKTGLPIIIKTLVCDREGKEFVKTVFNKEEFSMKSSHLNSLEVNYVDLGYSAEKLQSISERINDLLLGVEEAWREFPLIIDGYTFNKPHIDNSLVKLKIIQLKFAKLASIEEKIAQVYNYADLSRIS